MTVAITETQTAIGLTTDVGTDYGPTTRRLPVLTPAYGPQLELGILVPARWTLVPPQLVFALGGNIAPNTLASGTAGLSYRTADQDHEGRAGAFLGGLGTAFLFGRDYSVGHQNPETKGALVFSFRVTMPVAGGPHRHGWELSGTVGVRGYQTGFGAED